MLQYWTRFVSRGLDEDTNAHHNIFNTNSAERKGSTYEDVVVETVDTTTVTVTEVVAVAVTETVGVIDVLAVSVVVDIAPWTVVTVHTGCASMQLQKVATMDASSA